MTTPREKAKNILCEKLDRAENVIAGVMNECALSPDDKIDLLLLNIQERIKNVGASDNYELAQLEDIYVNLIVGVMSQDMLDAGDEISLLIAAIRKRIDNLDLYFEQLEKGTLKGPF
ncbi:hypothetical protein AMJ83_01520 [candidate division WOR_3 bacterium SM23_42]|uniref:Uncharacterized protein n=1 Tax=candidate division WOR_3 bacterium SM23_42 TaxID=1703779 RepID=A0A0S8FW59_UNCW3|nr:MAG: hypothetical protein AMJ83_01520 [candidate division WOR_3 bacterium SM23_42]